MSSQQSDSELGAEAMNEYVSVRIGDQLFGAPVDAIREVFAPQSVTHVPLAPDEVAGLLTYTVAVLALLLGDLALRRSAKMFGEPA